MVTKHRTLVRTIVAATALLALAACTPLPEYATTFTLTLAPAGGETIVIDGADVPQPEIFATFAGASEQKRLLMIIGNGDGADPAVGFLFWRYFDDAEGWVEQLTVSIDDTSYQLDATPLSGDAPVPDAFDVTPYSDPDYPGSLGRITGSIPAFTFVDASAGEIEVTLTGLDALVRANDDAPADPEVP